MAPTTLYPSQKTGSVPHSSIFITSTQSPRIRKRSSRWVRYRGFSQRFKEEAAQMVPKQMKRIELHWFCWNDKNLGKDWEIYNEKIRLLPSKPTKQCYYWKWDTAVCLFGWCLGEVHSFTDGVWLSKRQNIKPESTKVFRYTFRL